MPAPPFAARMSRLSEAAAITDILALAERPEVISFAGGLPAPETLAGPAIAAAAGRAIERDGAAALNYGPARGSALLRECVARRMTQAYGVPADPAGIQITSGGAEAFLLLTMALCDPGDTVLVGAPTYLVALHILRAMDVRMESVAVDQGGLSVVDLQAKLEALQARGVRPRFLYVIPSFQNPTGSTLDAQRRAALVALARQHDLTIVEDHAYGDLRFVGDPLPPLAALAPERVIFVHTFSKIVAPGLRLGWIAADPSLVDSLGLCKVATDSCASTVGQRIVLELDGSGALESGIEHARQVYRERRDHLLAALERHMPGHVGWNRPEGGFYVWVDLGPGADATALLHRALTGHDVAFVAGSAFHADGGGTQNLRLSYSLVAPDRMDEGVRRLALALTQGG